MEFQESTTRKDNPSQIPCFSPAPADTFRILTIGIRIERSSTFGLVVQLLLYRSKQRGSVC